jgi:hypothetical protein
VTLQTSYGDGYEETVTPTVAPSIFDPNPLDNGKFVFTGVPLAAAGDFLTATYTITAIGNSGPFNTNATRCVDTESVQGTFVVGDAYNVGWFGSGTGPWPWVHPCDQSSPGDN